MDFWAIEGVTDEENFGFRKSAKANLAINLLQHFGLIAAEDGGEDSQGRHQLRLADVDNVVKRVCDLADRMFDELDVRGWVKPSVLSPLELVERCGRYESIKQQASWQHTDEVRKAQQEAAKVANGQ